MLRGFQFFFLLCFLTGLVAGFSSFGQTTFGPNNPTVSSNNASIGTVSWTNTGNIFSSNDVRATSGAGTSQYLSASGFNFSIPPLHTIDGIKVEVERSSVSGGGAAVSLLGSWSTSLTRPAAPAGTNRCLVVIAATENGNGATDVTNLTYGGRVMTQVGEFSVNDGGAFWNRIEIWILNEAGIAAAGSTTIVPTINAVGFIENTEIYSSAIFANVDQYNPIFQIRNSATTGNTVPYQISTALNTLVGSMSVAAITCGNRPGAAPAPGGTNTYTINSGFTEGSDIYFANAGFTTSGASLETAYLASAGVGSVQPTFTFAGTANRQVATTFTLQSATALDNSVRILKGGAITGNNLAQSTVTWPTTDTYATYGGVAELWGTTWTPADINSANFGVVFSAIQQSTGGTLRVDHIRITVYATAPLPVELLYFKGKIVDQEVLLEWETATEINNDFFTVEYSPNGTDFGAVETIQGAGDSKIPIKYVTTYDNIWYEKSYFRLKQTDFDRQFSYSDVISVETRELIKDLSMFPNPANVSITILNSSEDDVAMRMISQTGIVVLDLKPQRHFQEIDISGMPNGLYVVELTRGRTKSSQKLLINH